MPISNLLRGIPNVCLFCVHLFPLLLSRRMNSLPEAACTTVALYSLLMIYSLAMGGNVLAVP